MDKNKKIQLTNLAIKLRKKSLKMAFEAGRNGAHLGGGLSMVEIFAVLYGNIISVESKNATDSLRDRVIISKGHCVLPYYSVLNEFGFLCDKDIADFETNGSFLHGHATRNIDCGIEFSGGSLGLGLSYAVGVALAGKLNKLSYKVYVVVGDGECNEGIVWEAFMSAVHFKLDNLVVIIDHNKLQYDGNISTIMNMGNLQTKMDAFGFHTIEVDGHDIEKLYNAFNQLTVEKPHAVIAHTIKGKGVSFMENQKEWHHSVLSEEQYNQAMSEQPNEI